MKHLLALLLAPAAAFAAAVTSDWSPNATALVAWQENASNGAAVWDRIGALQLGADVVASSQFDLSRSDLYRVTLHLAGDWYPRFSALDRGLGGARLDWQHTFGSDAYAPVFNASLGGDAVATVETARRGMTGAVTLRLGKRFGDLWRAALIQRFDRYDAKWAVFDARGTETALEVSREINEATRFTVTGRWRDGDVVTYARYRRPDLAAIARDQAALKTFHERMTAYATKAQTIAGRVAFVHATAEDTAVALAYEYARTSRTGLRFANSTVSLSFVRQY